MDVMEWLANSNLLEMIVDKLNPSSSPEVHTNTAETLCAITHNAPSALSVKLSSPSFVERIFGHALEDTQSKSGLVDSLSVCISLLDSKRATFLHWITLFEVNIYTSHRFLLIPRQLVPCCQNLIVEFIAVLLRSGNEIAEKELVSSGARRRILELFFEYPFHNALHHQVESNILSCLESKDNTVVDHLLNDCDVVGKIPQADQSPILSGDSDPPTSCSAGKQVPRTGNFGHITRISNSLIQLGNGSSRTQAYLQSSPEVHANTAETLSAIIHNTPSALSVKLSIPSFVEIIFGRAPEDTQSKSGLVDSLSLCISYVYLYRWKTGNFYALKMLGATYFPVAHHL
ncbi:hypothetical protein C5167_000475 [Papaver somniferum]|uniref:Uncharacterized protein n=1 Tax=Papaver somniferum TaxID=3469 RepID=A0A4Y7KW84_PAPSO|nr:hypothetical protein C5167_000475 [Papaver somniferum]